MNYFPRLYFDELIYSAIARYVRHTSCNQTSLRNLMGFDTLGFWFSYNLKTISKWTIENFNIDSDVLLKEHTLFNWAECLLPNEQADKLKECMVEKGGVFNVMKTAQTNFKYCPLCANEDREQYGETFWHRSHNIPFVTSCSKHECLLMSANITEQLSWKRVLSTAEEFVPTGQNPVPCLAIDLEISRELISWLHSGSYQMRKRINELLISRKAFRLVNGKNYVHQGFFDEYHHFAASYISADLHSESRTRRFFTFLCPRDGNLCGFVFHFIALRKYLETWPKGKDFSKPFIRFIPECINEFCNQFESPLTTEDFRPKTVSGFPGFAACCSQCGLSYLGKIKAGKVSFSIMDYGQVIREKIASERAKGQSFREISKVLNINRKVIASIHRRTFGTYHKSRGVNSSGFQALMEERKARLMSADIKSTGDLKTTFKTEYRWLLKYDKPWMAEFTRSFRKKQKGCPQVSIEVTDSLALKELKKVAADLKSSEVSFRITRSILLKNLSFRYRSKIDRLPKSLLFLTRNIETKKKFIKRVDSYTEF